jgi:hypothetical protein
MYNAVFLAIKKKRMIQLDNYAKLQREASPE